jgi:hypothetical protein
MGIGKSFYMECAMGMGLGTAFAVAWKAYDSSLRAKYVAFYRCVS